MISKKYKRLNEQLHKERKGYGTGGHRWADFVLTHGALDVLDYGCGKGTLAKALPFPIKQYDPCVPEHSKTPEPAELVVCTDVLEHVEPEMLSAVLSDLRRLIQKDGLLVISLVKSDKDLADGRNSHLIVQPAEWWADQLGRAEIQIVTVLDTRGSGPELAVLVC